MEAFFPPQSVAVLYAALAITRFENQRWTRARAGGKRGSSQLAGLLVDMTGVVGTLFAIGFVVAFGYFFGWEPAVGLIVIGLLATFIGGSLLGAITGDSLFVWIVATIAVWPLIFALYFSAFG